MIYIILKLNYDWTYSKVAVIPFTVTALEGTVVAVSLNSTVNTKSLEEAFAKTSPAFGAWLVSL